MRTAVYNKNGIIKIALLITITIMAITNSQMLTTVIMWFLNICAKLGEIAGTWFVHQISSVIIE